MLSWCCSCWWLTKRYLSILKCDYCFLKYLSHYACLVSDNCWHLSALGWPKFELCWEGYPAPPERRANSQAGYFHILGGSKVLTEKQNMKHLAFLPSFLPSSLSFSPFSFLPFFLVVVDPIASARVFIPLLPAKSPRARCCFPSKHPPALDVAGWMYVFLGNMWKDWIQANSLPPTLNLFCK